MEKLKSVFITGASGFVGNYLLKTAPESVEVLAQFRRNRPAVCAPHCRFLQIDFLNTEFQFIQLYRPSVIIHTAAMAQLDECEEKPQMAETLNAEVSRKLAEWAADIGARFILLSTDIVFDGKKGNYKETDKPHPINHYGATKARAEKWVLEANPDSVVVRTSIIYGKALGGRPTFTEVLLKRLRRGENVPVFTDQFRSPIYIEDLARALWELTENDFRGILHVAGPERLSRQAIGQLVCQLFNLDENLLVPVRTQDIHLRSPRPLDTSLNTELSRSVLRTTVLPMEQGLLKAFSNNK